MRVHFHLVEEDMAMFWEGDEVRMSLNDPDGAGDVIDFEAHAESCDALGVSGMNHSQVDAVASCLAAERFHLVQGPPGTGKTHALAKLVEELVKRGQRVLVTGFTHRAIHHALRKVESMVDCPVYKVSLLLPNDAEGIEFRETFAETGLLDRDGPYVIGATPFALFTDRAGEARFDVAGIDHAGNRSSSPEEADEAAVLIKEMLIGGRTRRGSHHRSSRQAGGQAVHAGGVLRQDPHRWTEGQEV